MRRVSRFTRLARVTRFARVVRSALRLVSGLGLFVAACAAPAREASDPSRAAVAAGPVEPTWEAFDAWREHFALRDEAWREVPWHASYRDGIVAAADLDRPLLLWVMNGHPLGPT